MVGIEIPVMNDVLKQFVKDGHMEIGNCIFGHYQMLVLDNENYDAFISQHGIKIKDKKDNNRAIYHDVFVFKMPTYLEQFIKEDPKYMKVEFLDIFDKNDMMKKFINAVEKGYIKKDNEEKITQSIYN